VTTSNPELRNSVADVVWFLSAALVAAALAVGLSMFVGRSVFNVEVQDNAFFWLTLPVAMTWLPLSTWGPPLKRYQRWIVSLMLAIAILPGLIPVEIRIWERLIWTILISLIYLLAMWATVGLIPRGTATVGIALVAIVILIVWIMSFVQVVDDSVVATGFVWVAGASSVILGAAVAYALFGVATVDGRAPHRLLGLLLTTLLALSGVAATLARL